MTRGTGDSRRGMQSTRGGRAARRLQSVQLHLLRTIAHACKKILPQDQLAMLPLSIQKSRGERRSLRGQRCQLGPLRGRHPVWMGGGEPLPAGRMRGRILPGHHHPPSPLRGEHGRLRNTDGTLRRGRAGHEGRGHPAAHQVGGCISLLQSSRSAEGVPGSDV
jgi:hypothetical protein